MSIRTEKGVYTCMVVDDNRTMLALSCAIFEQMGLRVKGVRSGEEAIKEARYSHFDIIFLDIEMPGMNGYKVTQLIRRSKKFSSHKSRIVALTASLTSKEQLDLCFKVGMNDCLIKPLKRKVLEKRLLSWIQKGDFRNASRIPLQS